MLDEIGGCDILCANAGTAGPNISLVILATTLFGLVAADITARTGSIGAAWGLHFANNTFAILILAVQGTIPGLALFHTPYASDDPILTRLMVADIAALLIVWYVLARVFRRQ